VLDLLALIRPTQVLQAVIGRVVVDVVHGILVVPLGEAEGDRHEHVDLVEFAVDSDGNVAAFSRFGGGDHASGRFETAEGGDPRGFVRLPRFPLQHRHLVCLPPPKLVTARLLLLPTATATDRPWMQPQTPSRLVTRSVRHPFFRPELTPLDRLRLPLGARPAVLIRGVRVLDLLALIRPTQVLQAVVGRVVVYVIHGILVVPLFEGEGARHEHVDVVVFAVGHDANVAAFSGFGGGDDAKGGFESAEGGDLWLGGSFGSFHHFCECEILSLK